MVVKGTMYQRKVDVRVSNHPDFVGIIPILLENPKSRRNLGWDRKNPDFEDLLPQAMSPEGYFRQILIILVIQGNEILNLDIQVKSSSSGSSYVAV